MDARPAIVRERCHCASGCRRRDIDLVCKVVGCRVALKEAIDVECLVSGPSYNKVNLRTTNLKGWTEWVWGWF